MKLKPNRLQNYFEDLVINILDLFKLIYKGRGIT